MKKWLAKRRGAKLKKNALRIQKFLEKAERHLSLQEYIELLDAVFINLLPGYYWICFPIIKERCLAIPYSSNFEQNEQLQAIGDTLNEALKFFLSNPDCLKLLNTEDYIVTGDVYETKIN